MNLTVATRLGSGELPTLNYSWDEDTGILGARISDCGRSAGPGVAAANGIVEITGPDGAWLHFETAGGQVAALEIAVWPEFEAARPIKLPAAADGYSEVSLVAKGRSGRAGRVVGVTLPVRAMQDIPSRTVLLCFGSARVQKAVRAADAMLVGTDRAGQLAALWLLNAPLIRLSDNPE